LHNTITAPAYLFWRQHASGRFFFLQDRQAWNISCCAGSMSDGSLSYRWIEADVTDLILPKHSIDVWHFVVVGTLAVNLYWQFVDI